MTRSRSLAPLALCLLLARLAPDAHAADVLTPLELASLLVQDSEESGDPARAARAREILATLPDAQPPSEQALILARACLATRPQDFACARGALERARTSGASAREVDQRLGLIAAALGEGDLARMLLDRSTPGGPADIDATLALARLAMERSDAVAAEAMLRRAAVAHPHDARLEALLGRVIADAHPDAPSADALAHVDAALAADPREVSARLLRARLRARTKPGSPGAAGDLAVHEALVRDTELSKRSARDADARRERLEIAERLVSLEPATGAWRLVRVRARIDLDQADEARALVRRDAPALRDASTLAAASTLAWSLGEHALGHDLARRALALGAAGALDSTDTALARQAAGACLLALGKPDDALHELDHALTVRAHRADLRTLVAEACLALGRRERAIQELRAAVLLEPRDARALASLGGLLREDGLRAEALALLDEALRLNPREASAHANRGLLLHDEGRETEAVTELLAAVELAPRDRLMRWNLGALLVMQGRMAEAIPHLEASLAADGLGPPAPAQAREWLGRAKAATTR